MIYKILPILLTLSVLSNCEFVNESPKPADPMQQAIDSLTNANLEEFRNKSESKNFQSDVKRMMNLIIQSLYKNKEIVIRELISNASDALDKVRYLAITDNSIMDGEEKMEIRIQVDKYNRIFQITDTGIGMTEEELNLNLGTIAKSGTTDFVANAEKMKANSDLNNLIGQFGVGFYSAYLVADKVVVASKSPKSEHQYVWESDSSTFVTYKDPRGNTLKRGTEITLYMKEDTKDLMEMPKITELVKRYSQFIQFDILLYDTETINEEVEDTEDEETKDKKPEKDDNLIDDEETEGKVSDEEPEKPKEKKTKTKQKIIYKWKLVNDNKPIWVRKKDGITDNEYNNFYKSFSKDDTEPLCKIHFSAEGEISFKSILYIPKNAPSNLYNNYGDSKERIKMYIRRVFITSTAEQMFPNYLSFVTGVVDSDDLPLNVSREDLQHSELLSVIKKKLVRKTLEMIKKLSPEKFEPFWKEYSTSLKMGIMEDEANRIRISKLLQFYSSNHSSNRTNLADYVSRMPNTQEDIYYIAGASRREVEHSPLVEGLIKHGYEVLFLVEPVDEFCIQALPDFDGKKFLNVAKEGLKISEHDNEKAENVAKNFEALFKHITDNILSESVSKVEISKTLVNSPAVLVASKYGWSGNMDRIQRSQAHQKKEDESKNYYLSQKKILQLNAGHPIVRRMLIIFNEDGAESQQIKEIAKTLYDTAALRSGFMIPDSVEFSKRVDLLLSSKLNVEDEKITDIYAIEDEDKTEEISENEETKDDHEEL